RPGGSLPEKLNSPKDLKAMYRLFDCESVTHQAILGSHQQYLFETTLPSRSGFTLIIHDASELEYTKRHSLSDELGQIGNGFRRGFIAQNSLVVCPETGATLGLANQVLHRRPQVKKGESRSQRQKRDSRESLLWLKGVQPMPADRKLVDVCDRGADTSEFIEHEANSGRTFLIRSSNNRNCLVGHDEIARAKSTKLHDHARGLLMLGTWELQVAGKAEFKSKGRTGKKENVMRKKRTATMAVSSGPVQLKVSRSKKSAAVCVWVVRVWEVDPPAGQERLEWFLITNHPTQSFDEADEVVAWYEKRWVVEEYHKCLKTGMSIEGYQFTDTGRLEPAIALTSITAITLLNLRDDSRNEETKDLPATDYIDTEYVEVLSAWRHGSPRTDWTVSEFVLALARLSGHQNRKGDHPPGWQKLWKGWHELHAMLTGARIAKKIKRCG
ncbi:MAG: IS4 family transposase, partial [Pirellulaceae bacterium]